MRAPRAARERVGEDLHVAREHDQLGAELVERARLRFLLGLGRRAHRQVVERDVIRRGERITARWFDTMATGSIGSAPIVAVKQVVQAVVELRHQDQRARARAGVVHRPAHREARRDGANADATPRGRAVDDGLEDHAHEEAPGLRRRRTARTRRCCRPSRRGSADRADDAGTVGADSVRMWRGGRGRECRAARRPGGRWRRRARSRRGREDASPRRDAPKTRTGAAGRW